MDLIMGVHLRSGGQGGSGARGGGGTSPELCYAAAGGRSWDIWVYRPPFGLGFGRGAGVERIKHLATQGRGLGLEMSCVAAGRCWAMAGLVGDGVLTTRVAYTPL